MKPQPGFVNRKVPERASWPPSASIGRFLPAGSGGWLPATDEGGAPRPPSNLTTSSLLGPLDLCLLESLPLPSIRCLSRKQMEGRGCQTSPSAGGDLSKALWPGPFSSKLFCLRRSSEIWVGRGGQREKEVCP